MQALPASLSFRWVRQVREIEQEWRACFDTGEAGRSFELQLAAEAAALPGVEVHYLVGSNAGEAVCVMPCFGFRMLLATVAAPWLQRGVAWVRAVWPGFLNPRFFVAGSPLSTSSDLLGFKDWGVPGRWAAADIRAVIAEVNRRAQEDLGIHFVLIKEFDSARAGFLREALGDRWILAPSPPTTHLQLPAEAGGYFAAIRSKYRNKYRRRWADGLEHGLSWETAPCAGAHLDQIHRLYLQTLDKADMVFERANRELFLEIERHLGDRCFYVLGFLADGGARRLAACELVLIGRDTLHPFYSGIDYGLKSGTDLYFNAFYFLIGEAERRGMRRIHLAQTAYEVKAELGAVCSELFVAVHHPRRWVRTVLRLVRRWLAPAIPFPQRDVFGTPPPTKSGRPQPPSAPTTRSAGAAPSESSKSVQKGLLGRPAKR